MTQDISLWHRVIKRYNTIDRVGDSGADLLQAHSLVMNEDDCKMMHPICAALLLQVKPRRTTAIETPVQWHRSWMRRGRGSIDSFCACMDPR